MVMEPSCKISLCIFSFILFWIYCLDFYHIYVHIKAQLFIVKANLQSMSFSVFCLPRLVVWSCSLTSIRAWLTLSPLSPGSPFYKEAVCPWLWPWCTMKRVHDMDSYLPSGKSGGIYLWSFWGRANCHLQGSRASCKGWLKDRGWKRLEGEVQGRRGWQKITNKCVWKRPSHGILGPRLCHTKSWDWALLTCTYEDLQGSFKLSSVTQGSAWGQKVVQWALRTEDCEYGEIQLMETTRWRKMKCSQCFKVQPGRKGKSSSLWPSSISLLQSGSSFEQFSVHSLETFLSSMDGIFVLSTLSCEFTTCHISPSLSYS